MEMPADFVCPLSQMVMLDPVTTSDGSTYERQFIEEWLKSKMTNPVTGKALTSKAVVRNQKCRAQIEEWSAHALASHNDVAVALKLVEKPDLEKRLNRLRLRILANQREQKGFNLLLLKENSAMSSRIVQLEQELKGKNAIFDALAGKTSALHSIAGIIDKSVHQWNQAAFSVPKDSPSSHKLLTLPQAFAIPIARSRTGSIHAEGSLPLVPLLAAPAVAPPSVAPPSVKPNASTAVTTSSSSTAPTTAPTAPTTTSTTTPTTTTSIALNSCVPLATSSSSSAPSSRRASPSSRNSQGSFHDNSPGASPLPSPSTSPSSHTHSQAVTSSSSSSSSTSSSTLQHPQGQLPSSHAHSQSSGSLAALAASASGSHALQPAHVPVATVVTTPVTSSSLSTAAAATHAFFAAHPIKRRASLGSPPSLASLAEEQRPPTPPVSVIPPPEDAPGSTSVSSQLKMAALSKLQGLTGSAPFSPEPMIRQLSSPDPTTVSSTTTTTSKWRFALSSSQGAPAPSTALPVAAPVDERGSNSSTSTLGTTAVNIVMPKTPNKETSLKFLNFGITSPAKPTHEKALYALMTHFKKNNAYDKWRELLEETTDVNAKSLGDTALVTAARRSEKKVVKMLIEAMAEVNLSADDGDTALIWAARKGDENIVKMLVEAKADVNMPDNDGNTPLACAQAEGHEDVINYLKVAVEEAGPVEVKKPKHGRSRTTTIDVRQMRSRSTTRDAAPRDSLPPSRDGSTRSEAPPRDSRDALRSP